jgi:hypothetical protein
MINLQCRHEFNKISCTSYRLIATTFELKFIDTMDNIHIKPNYLPPNQLLPYKIRFARFISKK